MTDLIQSDRAPQLLVAPDVFIPDDAVIGANVVLRSGVELGRGVVIEDSRAPRQDSDARCRRIEPAGHRGGHLGGRRRDHRQPRGDQRRCRHRSPGYVGDQRFMREGASLGEDSSLGRCGAIGRDAVVGARVRMQAFCGMAAGTVIEDDCFLGASVLMMAGITMGRADVTPSPSIIRRGSRIGSGAQILTGVEVGEHAVVGAGSVVTRDVPPGVTVAGVPARPMNHD